METFRPIVGYEESYEVSNLGRVKSVVRKRNTGNNRSRTVRERILKPCSHKRQVYLSVCLYKNGKKKLFAVHRIVAKAFISNMENKKEINHKNMNKTDNRVENLEWCTRIENIHDYINKKGKAHLRTRAN